MTDFADWQAPQAHATAIAATGVPLLRADNNLGNGGVSLTAGVLTTLFTNAGITQPSVEIKFSGTGLNASTTLPFIAVRCTWLDTASGLTYSKSYAITVGVAGAAVATLLHLVSYGDQLTVKALNLDPSAAATLTWTVGQCSHVVNGDTLLEVDKGAIPSAAAYTRAEGFGPAGTTGTGLQVGGAGVIGVAAPTVAPGSNALVLFPACSGLAVARIGSTSATGHVTIQDPGGLYDSTATTRALYNFILSGTDIIQELALPFGPVAMGIFNTGTSGSISAVHALTQVT